MEETRKQKYKDYRKSIINEDGSSSFISKGVMNDETSYKTIPISVVMKDQKDEKKLDVAGFLRKNKHKIKIIGIVVGLLLIILGIIIWAIIVWGA